MNKDLNIFTCFSDEITPLTLKNNLEFFVAIAAEYL